MTQLDATEVFVTRVNAAQQGLYAYILTMVPHAEDARDVLSETNLALWRKREQYESGRDFWPWACRFAQLQVMAYRKRRQRDRLVFKEELLVTLAEESEATEARRLLKLAAEKRQPPVERPPGIVKPNTIGAILPVTGPLSLYGRYFHEGLRMAVEEFNGQSSRQVRLVTSHSKGTPVDAVKAVRRLVLEEGAIGMVGAVFSVPTIGAAIAVGLVGSSAMGALSEKPEMAGRALIFVGLAEGIAIYGLIVSIMILGMV